MARRLALAFFRLLRSALKQGLPSWQLSANRRQLPANRRQLPTNRRQLLANRRQLPANRRQLPANGRQLPANSMPHGLRPAHRERDYRSGVVQDQDQDPPIPPQIPPPLLPPRPRRDPAQRFSVRFSGEKLPSALGRTMPLAFVRKKFLWPFMPQTTGGGAFVSTPSPAPTPPPPPVNGTGNSPVSGTADPRSSQTGQVIRGLR